MLASRWWKNAPEGGSAGAPGCGFGESAYLYTVCASIALNQSDRAHRGATAANAHPAYQQVLTWRFPLGSLDRRREPIRRTADSAAHPNRNTYYMARADRLKTHRAKSGETHTLLNRASEAPNALKQVGAKLAIGQGARS